MTRPAMARVAPTLAFLALAASCGHGHTSRPFDDAAAPTGRAVLPDGGATTSSTTTTAPPVAVERTTTTQRASRNLAAPRPLVVRSAGAQRASRNLAAPRPLVVRSAGGGDPNGGVRASWYDAHTRRAPDGGVMTFASRTMKKGTRATFCHDGRCVTATCTDYGPAEWTGRTFDLSREAFAALAPLSVGVVTVTWEEA